MPRCFRIAKVYQPLVWSNTYFSVFLKNGRILLPVYSLVLYGSDGQLAVGCGYSPGGACASVDGCAGALL